MPSLLLVIFALQLAIHVINSVGAQTVSELAWTLYNKLPTPTSGAVGKAEHQRKELMRLKRELKDVSPQDNFSRWAKLDRQHNKVEAEYQKTSSSVSSAKGQFTSIVSTIRWIATNGARFVLQFWFQKRAMYYLPAGWLPYYVEWLLSFPRAPLGSVSIQVWGMACAAVIALGAEAVGAAWALARGQTADMSKAQRQQQSQAVPMAMNGRADASQADSKKES